MMGYRQKILGGGNYSASGFVHSFVIPVLKGEPSPWICPFYWLKASLFGTMIWHQSSKSDKVHVSIWYMQ